MQSTDNPHDRGQPREKESSNPARVRQEHSEWASASRTGDAIRRLADSAAEVVGPGAERLAQGVKGAGQQVAGLADEATRSLGEGSAQLRESTEEVANACRRYVKEHPLLAVGIALGAGILLGRLLDSR